MSGGEADRPTFRIHTDRGEFAMKFWLGGDNNDLIDEVSELVLETVGGWLVSPAEGEPLEGEGAASP